MKIAAGPFKPSMKDSLTIPESSVDSDSSRGLCRPGKFGELNSQPTTVLLAEVFPQVNNQQTARKPRASDPASQRQQSRAAGPCTIITPLSFTSPSQFTEGLVTFMI